MRKNRRENLVKVQMSTIEGERRTAVFSKDGKYRFTLKRIWDRSKPRVMFIGLNPSTADGIDDDPTIVRIRNFAKDWGFGSLVICNLFAYRATKFMPLTTMGKDVIVGPGNDTVLKRIASKVDTIIFCWGVNGKTYLRHLDVINMFPDAKCIEISKDGFPKHPLYLKSNLKPKKYVRPLTKKKSKSTKTRA